jgi:hypothetical protein
MFIEFDHFCHQSIILSACLLLLEGHRFRFADHDMSSEKDTVGKKIVVLLECISPN